MRSSTNHSLRHTIENLSSQFAGMRTALRDAQLELLRLRSRLNRKCSHSSLDGLDLGALRRQIAFHCHPDRGGNEDLMARVNSLFDYLDSRYSLP